MFANNDVTMQWLPLSQKFVHKANGNRLYQFLVHSFKLPQSFSRGFVLRDRFLALGHQTAVHALSVAPGCCCFSDVSEVQGRTVSFVPRHI